MTDPEATRVPNRLDALVADRASRPIPPHSTSSSYPAPGPHYSDMGHADAVPRGAAFETRLPAADDATRPRNGTAGDNTSTTREHGGAAGPDWQQPTDAYSTSTPSERYGSDNRYPQLPNPQSLAPVRSDPHGTAPANGVDRVFTPPGSGGRLSPGAGPDSQLLQLSQIAAAQERVPEDVVDMANGASRKRMADGMVKPARDTSHVSPKQAAGHSRNPSTVSAASTAGTRIGELSAELKARLSYAMVKVNHGWQAHSIDQVESLASQVGSPASSASTIHLRNGSSTSPQLSAVSHRASNNTSPAANSQAQHAGRPGDPQWKDSPQPASRGSSASPVKASHGLAPPVSIQPSRHPANARREPNPRHVPSSLSGAPQTSPRAGLHTSPYPAPARHRSAMSEAMLVSPHTNVREQDAIESLLFMSSPGNPANLKHAFPSSASQPLPSAHAPAQRTALPTSQPRKSLPSGRPPAHARSHSHSHSHPQKRVGFEKSPSAMDVDEQPSPHLPAGSPMSVSRGTPRRRVNGAQFPAADGYLHAPGTHPQQASATPRLKQLPVSAGLTVSSKPRPALADDELDRMLDRAAAGDSESDGEIQLPAPRARRDGAGVVG